MNRIRKGDKVVILTGKDRGRKADILRVMPKENKALVRGMNMVSCHQKQTQTQQGGIIRKESPIHLSNIAILDPKYDKPTRIGFRVNEDGKKVRFAKRSGEIIDG